MKWLFLPFGRKIALDFQRTWRRQALVLTDFIQLRWEIARSSAVKSAALLAVLSQMKVVCLHKNVRYAKRLNGDVWRIQRWKKRTRLDQRAWFVWTTETAWNLESVATVTQQFPQRLHHHQRSFLRLFPISDARFYFHASKHARMLCCERRFDLNPLPEFHIT